MAWPRSLALQIGARGDGKECSESEKSDSEVSPTGPSSSLLEP